MQDKGVGIQRSGAVEIKLRECTNSKPGTKLVKRNTKGTVEWILLSQQAHWEAVQQRPVEARVRRNLPKMTSISKVRRTGYASDMRDSQLLNCSVNFVSPRGSGGSLTSGPTMVLGSYCTGMPKHYIMAQCF